MTKADSDSKEKKIPIWFIVVLFLSTIVFILFMILMGAMLPAERG